MELTGDIFKSDQLTKVGTVQVAVENLDNRFSEILFLKLQLHLKREKIDIFELYITMNFTCYEIERSWGTAKIGLTGGELKLTLTNAMMPFETIELVPEFKISTDIEGTIGSEEKTEAIDEDSIIAEISTTSPKIGIVTKIGQKGEKSGKVAYKYTVKVSAIELGGNERDLCWTFRTPFGKSYLSGWLNRKLGQLTFENFPSTVEAGFSVGQDNIKFFFDNSIFSLSKNKNIIANILTRRHFLQQMCTAEYMSRHSINFIKFDSSTKLLNESEISRE